jgi:glycosyltransferase involved in cell wall biosynthesis
MGLENLVAAVKLLDDVAGLRLAIAGSGSTQRLKAQSEALSLGDRVWLLGRVSEEDLPRWYRAADLFVLPTLAFEGFGLVTAEALASGTPVVGTPVGATPELLTPLEPRLVSRGTAPEDLAVAIRSGLSLATPAFRTRCREFALARFSWSTGVVSWERALEDVISRNGSEIGAVGAHSLAPRA